MRFAKFLFVAICIATVSVSVAAQSVIVTKRRVTYTRPKPQSKYKRTFVVNYPKIKAATPAISTKIEQQLSYFKNFEFTLKEEMTELQWLEEADYEITHNANGLLSAALTVSGSAAYPDGSTKHIVVNIKTGERQTASSLFTNASGLASLADKKLQAEISGAKKEIKANKENADIDVNELFDGKNFDVDSLNDFSVTKDGVTFYYEYGFPHVIEALRPNGEFKFSWAELRPFISATGLLASFVR